MIHSISDEALKIMADTQVFCLPSRLWFSLASQCAYDKSLVYTTQVDLARQFGVQRAAVNKAINKLVKMNYIRPYSKCGSRKPCGYFVNPHLIWAGDKTNLNDAKKTWEKLKQ